MKTQLFFFFNDWAYLAFNNQVQPRVFPSGESWGRLRTQKDSIFSWNREAHSALVQVIPAQVVSQRPGASAALPGPGTHGKKKKHIHQKKTINQRKKHLVHQVLKFTFGNVSFKALSNMFFHTWEMRRRSKAVPWHRSNPVVHAASSPKRTPADFRDPCVAAI